MKLIDFEKFPLFVELRKNMGITADEKIVLNIKTNIETIWNEIKKGTEIDKELIKVHDDETLGIKGSEERIIVYIKEQYFYPNEKEKEYKFHIAWCKTLESMYEGKHYNRYVAVQKEEPEFLVDLINRETGERTKNVTKRMSVCKNCLTVLNYKGYARANFTKKKGIYENFSLKEFLDTYKKSTIFVDPININNK